MDTYENLLTEAENESVIVVEKRFKSRAKGLIKKNKIGISRNIATTAEKACILAEEMGHYHTSCGNILDRRDVRNIKQEKRAMNWAYEKLVPLDKLISAYKAGVRGRNELALYLDVIEDFLEGAIRHYKEKYELYTEYGGYIIYFDPLGVMEMF